MTTSMFGDGSLALSWTEVRGRAGLAATLAIRGRIVAKGYRPGAVVLISAEITADQLAVAQNGYLGAIAPVSAVLAYEKQQWMMPNPPPTDEFSMDVEGLLRIEPATLDALEECRQGRDFYLRIDTTVLLVDRGRVGVEELPGSVHYQVHPTITWQEAIQVTQHAWGEVLQQWNRGVGIPLIVPLTAVLTDPRRDEIVRHLRAAWQKVDGADYPGSIAESRKALELLRALSPASKPFPPQAKSRDIDQRVHSVLDALFSLASAPPHVDGPTKNYIPLRADAVAAVAGTAAVAQQIFARLPNQV